MNPGRFSLLVVGSRGTGKRTAIQYCYKKAVGQWNMKQRRPLCLVEDAPLFIEPDVLPSNPEDLDERLKHWDGKTVVILNVDELTSIQQTLLFKAMSTDNGNFGIKSKVYQVRMVFTSSKPLTLLRENENYLLGVFWDRVSQLTVSLPNYEQEPRNTVEDFKCVWQKMEFSQIPDVKGLGGFPRNAKLERFLEESAPKIAGGFRDLDKVAVLYFNYRLLYYGDQRKVIEEKEDEVAKSTINDFWNLQLRSTEDDSLVNFRMDSKPSWSELHKAFKMQFRSWAINRFGSQGLAAKNLEIPLDTLKEYSERGLSKRPHKGGGKRAPIG